MSYDDGWYRFQSQFYETEYEKQERWRKRRLKDKKEESKEQETNSIVVCSRSGE